MKKIYSLLLLCLIATMGVRAEETKTLVYSNDFETSSDWTAKGRTDGWTCNPGTTTANTFASNVIGVGAGGGDMGLVSPSFTIDADVKIIDVELKFKMDACTSGKSSGIEFVTSDVNVNNGYVSSGIPFFAIGASANGNGYWSSITVGGTDYKTTLNEEAVAYENNALNRNSTGIVTLNVRFNFTNKTATYSLTKGTTKVAEDVVAAFANANATTLDRIFIHAGKSFGGVTIDDVKVYSVTTDEVVTTYTASFTETNELNPTVTIYSDENCTQAVVNGTLEANKTYYYKAVLAGYNDKKGSFTVGTEDPSVSFAMTALERYVFTVNAVCGDDVVKTLYTDNDSYEGKKCSVAMPKYLTDDNNKVTYAIPNDTYYTEFTSSANNATQTVSYTAYEGTAYFYEGESYNALGTKLNSGNCSNNTAARGLNNTTLDLCTVAEAGQYNVSYAICSNNVKEARTCSFYRNSSEYTLATQSCQWSVNYIKTTGSKSFEAGFAAGDVLQMYASDGNVILDYVLLERTGDLTEDITINSTTRLASYVTTFALDFSKEENLKAYIATAKDSKSVKLSEVTYVPAGTPVIIRSLEELTENKPYSLPLCESTTDDVSGNILKGSPTESYTVKDGDGIYALSRIDGMMHPVEVGVPIPAKKAYLKTGDSTGAKEGLKFVYENEEEATAINNAAAEAEAVSTKLYNAAGQQVGKGYRGMVIDSNGKKSIR